jgi:methylated-DNA-protein-cysteine methyltransferase-like protein
LSAPTNPRFELIWAAVTEIPPGRVASYGQVAEWVGLPGRARLVGKAMKELPERSTIPWYRVLGAGGRISLEGEAGRLQRELLEAEGVRFTPAGRVDLETSGWKP